MRRLFHSSELPWGWPDALAIGWGLWFTIVAFTGGHLPVLWFWYTDPAPVLAVAGAVLITPALVWLEREQRAGSAIPPEEQHLRSLRRTFLKDAKPSFRAIPAVAGAD